MHGGMGLSGGTPSHGGMGLWPVSPSGILPEVFRRAGGPRTCRAGRPTHNRPTSRKGIAQFNSQTGEVRSVAGGQDQVLRAGGGGQHAVEHRQGPQDVQLPPGFRLPAQRLGQESPMPPLRENALRRGPTLQGQDQRLHQGTS